MILLFVPIRAHAKLIKFRFYLFYGLTRAITYNYAFRVHPENRQNPTRGLVKGSPKRNDFSAENTPRTSHEMFRFRFQLSIFDISK